jgi:hypothetical protein
MAEAARQAFSASEPQQWREGHIRGFSEGYDAGYATGRRDGVLAERKRCVFLLCEAGFHEAAAELGML